MFFHACDAGSVNGRNMMQQFLYKPGSAALLGGGPGVAAGARGVSPSNAGPAEFSNFAENALAAMSRVSSGSGAGLPAPPPPTQQKVRAPHGPSQVLSLTQRHICY